MTIYIDDKVLKIWGRMLQIAFLTLVYIMYDIVIFVTVLVTTIIIIMLTLGRTSNTLKQERDTKPVYYKELPSSNISDKSSDTSVTKEYLSDKEFKELFFDSNKSIIDIAAAGGYRSNSSVYRRAKKLGLSVKDRKKIKY